LPEAQGRPKPAPIPGLDPGGPARALPAVFVRESLAATREALQSAYRLSLDRRIVEAVAVTAALVGAPLAQPPSATWKNGWQIRAGAVEIGSLAELPDFDQAHALLVAWARRQLSAHPVTGDATPSDSAELLFDEAAVRATRLGAKLWAQPARRAQGIHEMSVGLVSLAFQVLDAMQAADRLLAAAWATTAFDEALGHAQNAQRSLIAFALGYRGAAQRVAAQMADSSPVRAYLLSDDARLAELAAESASDTTARFLWMRRLLRSGRYDEAQRWEQARLADYAAAVPVVLAKVVWGDFKLRRSLAGDAPVLVLLSAFRDSGGSRAEQAVRARALPGDPEQTILGRLGVEPGKALSAFDEAVSAMAGAKTDPVADAVGAYYRGAMLTALRAKGRDYLHTLSSNPAAASFARSLAADSGPTASTFKHWFDYLVASDSGQDVTGKLLENVQALPGIGGLALTDIFYEIQHRIDWASPTTYAAARGVVSRLDSRPADRVLAGDIAKKLPDLRMLERMYRSVTEVAPGAFPGVHVFLARYTGDPASIDAALALAELNACDRISLLETRVKLGLTPLATALREMEVVAARDTGSADALGCLVGVLQTNQRHADIVRLARAWLDHHPDPRGLDGVSVRRYLAAALSRLGNNREALRAIEPALSSGHGGAMRAAAVLYAIMGQSDKAQAMAEAAVERYPGTAATALLAEVAWRLGKPADAARILKQSPLRTLDYYNAVARVFADVFVRDKTPGTEAALQEILKVGLGNDAQAAFIDVVGKSDAKLAVAFMEKLTDPTARMLATIRNFDVVRAAKGDAAAEAWGRQRLAGAPGPLAARAIADRQEEPLWLLDEPGPGEARDVLWLFRAVAAQWHSPSRHLEVLKQHFASPGNARYYLLGRVVMGLEDEAAGTALRGTTPSQSCEVAFYLGARAQGLGKLDEAHDWYRAAIETSLPGESEYRFALAQLTIWAAQGKSLARLAKEGSP
jgi:tetratricopeptide (TPR) repeat protein